MLEERQAGRVLVPGVIRGEVLADVAQAGGAKEGVDDGVRQRVGVAVALGAEIGRHDDPGERQGAARDEGVRVPAHADADHAGASAARRSSAAATSRSSGVVTLMLS